MALKYQISNDLSQKKSVYNYMNLKQKLLICNVNINFNIQLFNRENTIWRWNTRFTSKSYGNTALLWSIV
jgi:hypothetical protein